MEKFYDFLRAHGIVNAPDVEDIILKMEPEEIITFSLECYFLTETSSRPEKEDGIFNFSVSSSISGGTSPCSDPQCRINNSYDLATFSALYAERVYIPNPFEHIYLREKGGFEFDNANQFLFFVNQVVGDVMVLLSFKPLFERGIFKICPQMISACEGCWARMRSEQDDFRQAYERTEEEIFNEIIEKIEFKIDEKEALVLSGPENYIGGEVIRFGVKPDSLKKFITKKPYTFKPDEVKKLGLHQYFVGEALDDILLQKFFMDKFNTSYLTNRGIEGDIIKHAYAVEVSEERNKELEAIRGISHQLPFVRDCSLEHLLYVRDESLESFSVYRDAIRKAITEANSEDSKRIIEELKNDVIEPELNKIRLRIKTNQEKFKERLFGKLKFNNLVLWSGVFSSYFFWS